MIVSYAVVGHHRRREQAESLSAELNAVLVMDEGDRGSLATHDLAWWSACTPEADWVMVLEDDAEPILGFRHYAEQALAHLPGSGAVSFYLGTGRPRQGSVSRALSRAGDASWLRSRSAWWGPSIALPAGHVVPMLERVQSSTLPYDQRLSTYLRSAGIRCYYTLPSLVEHADGPSLIRDCPLPRRAHRVEAPSGFNTRVVDF